MSAGTISDLALYPIWQYIRWHYNRYALKIILDQKLITPNLHDDVAIVLLVELEAHVRREGGGRRVLGPGVHDAGGGLAEGVVAAVVDLALLLVRHAALLQDE